MHRVTNMFVEYFSEAARPHTMVLIPGGPERSEGLLWRPPPSFNGAARVHRSRHAGKSNR